MEASSSAVYSGRNARLVRLRSLTQRLPILQAVAIIALFLYGSATIDGYSSRASIVSMLVLASFLGIAAGGQTLCILIGEIDLSLAAVISGADIATCTLSGSGWPFVLVFLVIVGVAGAIGVFNGYVLRRFELHSLIVTLGTGAVISGAILVWTNGGAPSGAAPMWLSNLDSPIRHTLGFIPLPPVVVIWVVFAAVLVLVLTRTPIGRRLYAAGANRDAAELALVRTKRVWIGTFAASAVCAALAGILLGGFSTTGVFNIGDPYLFTTIAAVVVGGTSMLGARGDYVRTILGVLILTQVSTLLVGYGQSVTQIVTGGAIIAVVSFYGRETHMRNRI